MLGTGRAARWLVLLCFFAALPGSVAATVIGGPVTNPANGHRYYLLGQNNWPNSESEAVGLGGHLATIDDAAENQLVYSTFGAPSGTDRALWIGLNDAAAEGSLVWADGSPLGYTNWYAGGNGNNESFDYAFMLPSQGVPTQGGTWSFSTAFITFGVVEVVPEPGCLAIACAAPLVLLRRRRVS